MNHIINVYHENKTETSCNKVIESVCNTVLQNEYVDTLCVINVLFTDDSGIRKYNRDYRSIDKATDVLSFPMQTFIEAGWSSHGELEFDEDTGELPLGDIIISMETVKRQSEEYGNSVEHETAYMIIHSTLHLLGYDHDNEKNEKIMHSKAKEILEMLGYKNK